MEEQGPRDRIPWGDPLGTFGREAGLKRGSTFECARVLHSQSGGLWTVAAGPAADMVALFHKKRTRIPGFPGAGRPGGQAGVLSIHPSIRPQIDVGASTFSALDARALVTACLQHRPQPSRAFLVLAVPSYLIYYIK